MSFNDDTDIFSLTPKTLYRYLLVASIGWTALIGFYTVGFVCHRSSLFIDFLEKGYSSRYFQDTVLDLIFLATSAFFPWIMAYVVWLRGKNKGRELSPLYLVWLGIWVPSVPIVLAFMWLEYSFRTFLTGL